MFTRIGRVVSGHPVGFVIGWAVLLAVMTTLAVQGLGTGGLFDRLASTEATTPDSDSEVVYSLTLSDDDSGETVIVVAGGVDVAGDWPGVAAAATAARGELAGIDGVASVHDAFMLPDPTSQEALALLSSNGDGFATLVTLDEGLGDHESQDANERVAEAAQGAWLDALHEYDATANAHTVSTTLIADSITDLVQEDLVRGESVSLPVALVLLVIVFGGLLAAGLPLVGAVVSILVGLGALWCLTFVQDVNSFILNVISIIGLALSIDYGLLLVSRYREEAAAQLAGAGGELPAGDEMKALVRATVVRTVATAGRTVSFSALTIACSIAGLFVMRSPILRTIGAGAVIVTLLAVSCTLTLVPAIITLLGARLVRPSALSRVPGLRRVLAAVGDSSSDDGVFSRLSRRVVAHPWIVMLAVVALLAAMASPIGSLRLRTNFAEYMPAGSDVHAGYDILQEDYPALASPTISIVAQTDPPDTAGFVSDLGAMDGVTHVTATDLADHEHMTLISVLMDVDDPVGPRATDAVDQIRAMDPGYRVWVGGQAAQQTDFTDSIAQGAPWAALIVVAAVLVLLFCMTGSFVVPLKALIINTFSLVASLGATAWLFEGGHLGLPRTAGLETFIVACLMAFGFGLAMDYEVFLLARIAEYWQAGYDNDEAVARGLQRSGRIITSAAAIIIAVFLGFVSGEMIAIKQIGVGLAIMVAADATLVRLLLVPATMTVLGQWNWWAPEPLARLYRRLGGQDRVKDGAAQQ
ncbi:Membrane transport protein, MMPL domain [Propionibacterium ruminifibrarum]|uniref:Membrane transport protein, MMPL domain n=1 Tax=Propionibacterium ruminifibrarum TaxID=1962131 RepID=A0A375I7R4_9ACTN|nr:MMPL family transporter [Propionibacterium ruminifibrarum]SPF69489.1 Membrane transport protein, MMPL domain [Propionibacterium ruminifibrarum]